MSKDTREQDALENDFEQLFEHLIEFCEKWNENGTKTLEALSREYHRPLTNYEKEQMH